MTPFILNNLPSDQNLPKGRVYKRQMHSWYLKPSIFRTSLELERKLVSFSPLRRTLQLHPISQTNRIFEPNFRFPWRFEKSGFHRKLIVYLAFSDSMQPPNWKTSRCGTTVFHYWLLIGRFTCNFVGDWFNGIESTNSLHLSFKVLQKSPKNLFTAIQS